MEKMLKKVLIVLAVVSLAVVGSQVFVASAAEVAKRPIAKVNSIKELVDAKYFDGDVSPRQYVSEASQGVIVDWGGFGPKITHRTADAYFARRIYLGERSDDFVFAPESGVIVLAAVHNDSLPMGEYLYRFVPDGHLENSDSDLSAKEYSAKGHYLLLIPSDDDNINSRGVCVRNMKVR